MVSPRERMVVSAALLIRERGAHPTAIADVLEHSGAPRGSAYHYFPGGRTQLLCEAIDYAGEHVAARIAKAARGIDALDALVESYRRQLLRTDFRAGVRSSRLRSKRVTQTSGTRQRPVIDRAAAAFARWTDLTAQLFVADGIAAARADELAMLMTTALEGAIVVARASRDVKPLDVVHRQLRALLQAEASERTQHDDR